MIEHRSMKSQEAVQHLKDELNHSLYSIARQLSINGVNVQSIQVSNYYYGRCVMSKKVSNNFFDVFRIEITDFRKHKGRPSAW